MINKIIYSKHDVMLTLGISSATLTRWIKANKIPQPFKLGENTSANKWRREDIERYINEKAAN